MSLTRQYPQSAWQILARKIASYLLALLAASFLFGTEVLSLFRHYSSGHTDNRGPHRGSDGLEVAESRSRISVEGQESDTLEDALAHAFYPLTLPLTVDPGAISVAITLGAQGRAVTFDLELRPTVELSLGLDEDGRLSSELSARHLETGSRRFRRFLRGTHLELCRRGLTFR